MNSNLLLCRFPLTDWQSNLFTKGDTTNLFFCPRYLQMFTKFQMISVFFLGHSRLLLRFVLAYCQKLGDIEAQDFNFFDFLIWITAIQILLVRFPNSFPIFVVMREGLSSKIIPESRFI